MKYDYMGKIVKYVIIVFYGDILLVTKTKTQNGYHYKTGVVPYISLLLLFEFAVITIIIYSKHSTCVKF